MEMFCNTFFTVYDLPILKICTYRLIRDCKLPLAVRVSGVCWDEPLTCVGCILCSMHGWSYPQYLAHTDKLSYLIWNSNISSEAVRRILCETDYLRLFVYGVMFLEIRLGGLSCLSAGINAALSASQCWCSSSLLKYARSGYGGEPAPWLSFQRWPVFTVSSPSAMWQRTLRNASRWRFKGV